MTECRISHIRALVAMSNGESQPLRVQLSSENRYFLGRGAILLSLKNIKEINGKMRESEMDF